MIFKTLAVAVVLFLVYIFFFKKSREDNIKDKSHDKIEDVMVECPKCGTYVSKKEGILSNGQFYCSKECLGN